MRPTTFTSTNEPPVSAGRLRIPAFKKAPKGNAGPGTLDYRIEKSTDYYYAFIAGVAQHNRHEDNLEVCWPGGVTGAQWMNEMLDWNDANAGP